MPPLESQLLATVSRHLQALHRRDPSFAWRKRHGSPMSTTGDPDIYGSWHGTHFEIELKRPGEDPTPLQRARIAEWGRAGAHCFVVHTIAEWRQAINTLRKVVDTDRAASRQ